jgi:hypothetical protein
LAILALMLNWAFVVYMSLQYDPRTTRLAMIVGDHAILLFACIAIVGTVMAIIGAVKGSKAWYVVAFLNSASFVAELCVS